MLNGVSLIICHSISVSHLPSLSLRFPPLLDVQRLAAACRVMFRSRKRSGRNETRKSRSSLVIAVGHSAVGHSPASGHSRQRCHSRVIASSDQPSRQVAGAVQRHGNPLRHLLHHNFYVTPSFAARQPRTNSIASVDSNHSNGTTTKWSTKGGQIYLEMRSLQSGADG
jgi:hypothetical protein